MNQQIPYLIFFISFFAAILFLSVSVAKTSKSGTEKVILITDKPYYFAGENIYYKLFYHSNIKANKNEEEHVVYTELWDEHKQLVERQIVRLSPDQAHGIFRIDKHLEQGNYLIRAYLKKYWKGDKTESAQIHLLILNVDQKHHPFVGEENDTRENSSISGAVKFSDRIDLSTHRESYQARSEIKVNVKLPDQPAEKDACFVATARYREYFPPREPIGTLILDQVEAGNHIYSQNNSPSKIYLRGNYNWKEKKKKQIYELIVYSVLGKDPLLGYEYTNKEGEFNFDISHLKGNEHVYLSAVNGSSDNVEIFEKTYPELKTGFYGGVTRQWNKQVLDRYMENYRVRQTINENYNLKKLEIKSDTLRIYDTTRVYKLADKTYELSEYVDFADMPELIREILLYVKINKKNDRYRLFIFNRTNPELKQDLTFPELERDPLFLVNGIPTKDHDYIVNMDVDNIDVIEILYSKEALFPFGWLGRSGILALYTHQPVKVPNFRQWSVKGIFDPEGRKTYDYNMENIEDPVPNFDPLPLWDPELKMTGNRNGFSFYCGDEQGDLEIKVIGLNNEGKLIGGSTVVRIEPLLD